MRPRAVLILGAISLLLAACTHSVADQEDSTRDFSFSVAQTANPPALGTRIDVPFEITIGNKTDVPVTVERIAVQSFEAGDYQIPFRSRPFDKVIAPGEKQKFEFWANAIVTDPTLGTRAPLVLRTMIDFNSPNGKRQEVFVRNVNGRIGFSATKPIGE